MVDKCQKCGCMCHANQSCMCECAICNCKECLNGNQSSSNETTNRQTGSKT